MAGRNSKPAETDTVIARLARIGNDAAMNPAINPKLLNDPVFQRVLADARSIPDRFAAEPVYAKTGKGFLKSEGAEKLRRIKAAGRTSRK